MLLQAEILPLREETIQQLGCQMPRVQEILE